MKLCVDCKFFAGNDHCLKPRREGDTISRVDGKPRGLRFCSSERAYGDSDSCEPNPPLAA